VTDSLPRIDLGPLRDGDDTARLASEVDNACREIGFFVVVNHGIAGDVRAAMLDRARAFFALPLECKNRVAIADNPAHRGFSPIAAETLEEGLPADLKEAYDLGVECGPEHPEVRRGTPLHGPNPWPELEGFRAAVEAYFDAGLAAQALVHQALALALGLDRDHFAPALVDPLVWLRLLHYPPPSIRRSEHQLACGAHSDYGTVTLLAQDDVGGLEVRRRDGTWMRVRTDPDQIVVNLGDLMARWTNGRYVSTLHRVVMHDENDRYSLPFFGAPAYHTLVEALPTCTRAGEPARYRPIVAGEYLMSRFVDTHDYLSDQRHAS
jgi:isopenicillin N synthase-like dioxygenase